MASSGSDLIAKAKKFREVDVVQHKSVPNVPETLENIFKFLQEHETPSMNDCTHTVFDNYADWWTGQKSSYKLAIAEDNTLDTLHRFISNLYDLGIPLTLTEKRTPEIRFVQDIEIWGTTTDSITVEDLMHTDKKFTRLLGQTMGEIFPNHEFLDVVVFDASGLSKTKGVKKTSVRLVWSSIVVDKERAARIRDYVVHKFKDSKDEEIKNVEKQIQHFNNDNQWNSVFSDAIYFGRFGIRMPLNDRVSPAPLKKPEMRPFAPFGVIRFLYADGDLQDVEEVCKGNGLEGVDWLKIGCIRRDAGTPLTEWVAPTWKGERAPRTCVSMMSIASRTPGQVKIRTKSGSETTSVRVKPRDPQQKTEKERLVTVEREFDGTVEEFRERLEQQLGKQTEESISQEGGNLVWRQSGETGARIEFKASNKRVYIIGKAHQIRSLLNVIAPFAKEVGEAARSVTHTARTAGSHRAGSEHAGAGGTACAPSAVYAPSTVYAPSAVYAASSASRAGANSTRESGPPPEPSKRVACRAFEPQSGAELALSLGDHITVTHDPEEGQHNFHRWVYGLNETTEQRGWFPLSHTNQETAADA